MSKVFSERKDEILTKHHVNARVVNALLVVALLITIPDIIVNIFFNISIVGYSILGLYLIVYSFMGLTIFYRKRISYAFKGYMLMVVFLILGLLSIVTYGGVSTGIMFIFGGISAAMFLDFKKNITYIFAATLFVFLLGRYFYFPMVVPDYVNVAESEALLFWITRSFYIGVYLFTLYYFIYLLRYYTNASISRLESVAYYDSLTLLPNKHKLKEDIDKIIEDPEVKSFGLLYIDVDNFKRINDVFGRKTGDKILSIVAKRLKNLEFKEDSFARITGDEFVLLIQNEIHKRISQNNIQKLRYSIEKPIVIDNVAYEITASYGYSMYPDDGNHANILIQKSEIAMREAKKSRHHHFIQYRSRMSESINFQHRLEFLLEELIHDNDLLLAFQPQIDISTNRISGFEVLSRFKHPDIGFISPNVFIPILEESGLIVTYGYLLIEKAIQSLILFENAGLKSFTMAINISSIQLNQPDFVKRIDQLLQNYPIDPRQIEFEITESTFIKNRDETNMILRKIRNLGVNISLDDFGTGYSSLSYLMELEIDQLKIDKSFINDIEKDITKQNILESIVKMAHVLSLQVVAEGVENKKQLDIVERNGCNYVQGYYFYKPMPLKDVKDLLIQDVLYE